MKKITDHVLDGMSTTLDLSEDAEVLHAHICGNKTWLSVMEDTSIVTEERTFIVILEDTEFTDEDLYHIGSAMHDSGRTLHVFEKIVL